MKMSKKSQQTRRDHAVQGTNDSSVVSKWSTCHVGYFSDQFLKHFISKRTRRSPLINRGYFVRAKAIEYVFKNFIESYSGQKIQIISLGAGFDSSYFRLKCEGLLNLTLYVEVDFPELVKRKTALINGNESLRSMLNCSVDCQTPNCVALRTSDYILLGVDLTNLDQLGKCFHENNIDSTVPTLLVSEVVLTYIHPKSADKLIEWLGHYFDTAVYAAYEQVYPHDGFGQVMMNHFTKIGSPLRCIDTYPSVDQQAQRFMSLGWRKSCAVDMNHFYEHFLPQSEHERIEKIEPFDEYEAWHLKCMHYILVTAFQGDGLKVFNTMWDGLESHKNTDPECDKESGIHHSTDHAVQSQVVNHTSSTPGYADKLEANSSSQNNSSQLQQPSQSFKICEDKSDDKNKISDNYSKSRDESCSDAICLAKINDFQSLTNIERNVNIYKKTDKSVDEGVKNKQTNSDITNCFGHRTCTIGDGRYLSSGGFGVSGTVHSRFKHITLVDIGNRLVSNFELIEKNNCKLSKQSNSGNDSETTLHGKFVPPTERMYHTMVCLNPNADNNCRRILLYGGRLSPVKTCDELCVIYFYYSKNSADVRSDNDSSKVEKERDKSTVESCKNYSVLNQCSDMNSTTPVNQSSGSYLKWTSVEEKGDKPAPRWRHASCLLNIAGTDYLLIHGGRNTEDLALSGCYLLNTQTFFWHKVSLTGDNIGPLHSHSCTKYTDNTVYISGGMNHKQQPSGAVYRVHVDQDSDGQFYAVVHQIPLHNIKPRYSHTSTVIRECLVLVGGVSTCYKTPGATIIHLQELKTKLFNIQSEDIILLHNHDMTQLNEMEFVIFGGGGNCFSFGTHYNKGPYLLQFTEEHFLF